MKDCYLGLGSNLREPAQQIRRAIQLLRQATDVQECSSLYQSDAMVRQAEETQPDYINAVVHIKTDLKPHRLLALTQELERRLGRIQSARRWQPRIIDIDLLWLEDTVMNSSSLTLPHSGLLERPFVLIPLAEISPHFILPNHTPIKNYLTQLRDQWNVRPALVG